MSAHKYDGEPDSDHDGADEGFWKKLKKKDKDSEKRLKLEVGGGISWNDIVMESPRAKKQKKAGKKRVGQTVEDWAMEGKMAPAWLDKVSSSGRVRKTVQRLDPTPTGKAYDNEFGAADGDGKRKRVGPKEREETKKLRRAERAAERKRSKVYEEENGEDEEDKESEDQEKAWAQCGRCEKWRRLKEGQADWKGDFFCKMNTWDSRYNHCDKAEQDYEDEEVTDDEEEILEGEDEGGGGI